MNSFLYLKLWVIYKLTNFLVLKDDSCVQQAHAKQLTTYIACIENFRTMNLKIMMPEHMAQ